MKYAGDELHHFGWNSCSSCYSDPTKKRNRIIIPAIGSDRIYILNVDDLKAPVIEKVDWISEANFSKLLNKNY